MIDTSKLTNKRIAEYLAKGKRFDDRELDEFREISIKCGISKKAEGSAEVTLGKTKVFVGVKLDVMEPYTDSPNKGNLMVTAELLPLSHQKYEYGPPRFNAIELGRLVDRGIRESKFIDFEKLCIEEGKKVWNVFIDVYSINDDGNLLDAAFIGALTALKSAKMPVYDKKTEKVDYEKESKTAVPLTKNFPINFSVHKIKDKIFLDPTIEEESASEGRLILAVIPDSPINICSMQKGETTDLSEEEFGKILDLVEKKYKTFFPNIIKLIDEAVKENVK